MPNLLSQETNSQLDELHSRVTQLTADQAIRDEAERQKAIEMAEKLHQVGKPFEQLYNSMERNGRLVVPREVDGKFLIIEKHEGRFRIAVSENKEKGLGGYLPEFDDIDEWEEVTFENGQNKPEATSIFYWDKPALEKYATNSSIYWGISKEIKLGGIKKQSLQEITDNLAKADKYLILPESLQSPTP
jgi:hypothetical protein